MFLTTWKLVQGFSDVATTNVCKVDSKYWNTTVRYRLMKWLVTRSRGKKHSQMWLTLVNRSISVFDDKRCMSWPPWCRGRCSCRRSRGWLWRCGCSSTPHGPASACGGTWTERWSSLRSWLPGDPLGRWYRYLHQQPARGLTKQTIFQHFTK